MSKPPLRLRRTLVPTPPQPQPIEDKSIYARVLAFVIMLSPVVSGPVRDRRAGPNPVFKTRPHPDGSEFGPDQDVFPGFEEDFVQGAWISFCILHSIDFRTGQLHDYRE